jgi:hypothetical protein
MSAALSNRPPQVVLWMARRDSAPLHGEPIPWDRLWDRMGPKLRSSAVRCGPARLR